MDEYDLTGYEQAQYDAVLAKDAAEMDAIAAEIQHAAFTKAGGSRDRSMLAQAPKQFKADVNRQAAKGDAGGAGRTQHAPAKVEIKSGMTLWELSQKYGVSVDEIRALNNNIDPRKLQLGSMLRLRADPAPTNAAPSADESRRFDPRTDAIEPVYPLESLIGGLKAIKAVPAAINRWTTRSESKAPSRGPTDAQREAMMNTRPPDVRYPPSALDRLLERQPPTPRGYVDNTPRAPWLR
jgi:LysM repeat protein